MPEYQRQLLQAPTGMASALDRATLPLNRAQELTGFLPSRYGHCSLAPSLRVLERNFVNPITSIAFWRNPSASAQDPSQILLFIDNSGTMEVYAAPVPAVSLSYQSANGQHSYFGSLVPIEVSGATPAQGRMHAIQFKDELYLWDSAGQSYRFYRSGGTNYWYTLGLSTPGTPTLTDQTQSGFLSGVYQYQVTYVDERDRESSPSTSVTTNDLAGKKVTVQRGSLTTGQGVVSWNLYRRNPGSETYNWVNTIAIGTTNYEDNIDDETVALSTSAPNAGQNDAPLNATFGAVWNGRLVLNNTTNKHLVQISNANAPTQFASYSDPTDSPADGLRLICSGGRGGEVTGFANLGAYLAIFTRTDTFLLQGEDNATFFRQHVHERGCIAPGSIQRARNYVLFLSDDGVYAIGYAQGFLLEPIAVEIADKFRGFVAKHEPPLHANDYASLVQANATIGQVSSWYVDDIYYLSTYVGTLAYDVVAGGWADTGYGFLCSVAVMEGGTDWLRAPLPTCLFAIPGDTSAAGSDVRNGMQVLYSKLDDRTMDANHSARGDARIVTRPYDGQQMDPHGRVKKASRYRVWGKTGARPGEQIGTLTLVTDRGIRRDFPIRAGLKTYEPGVLYEQQLPAYAIGRALWFEENYTAGDIERSSALLQYDATGR